MKMWETYVQCPKTARLKLVILYSTRFGTCTIWLLTRDPQKPDCLSPRSPYKLSALVELLDLVWYQLCEDRRMRQKRARLHKNSLLKLWYSLEPCVLGAARWMFRENRRGSNRLLWIDKESMLLFWQWFSRQETEWLQRLGAHWWQRTSAKKRSSLTYVARKTYHAYSRKGIGGDILRWIVVPSQILTLNIGRSFDHSNGTRFPITRDSQGHWTPDIAWVRRERWQPKTVVFLIYLKQLRTLKVLLRLLLLCEGYCVY